MNMSRSNAVALPPTSSPGGKGTIVGVLPAKYRFASSFFKDSNGVKIDCGLKTPANTLENVPLVIRDNRLINNLIERATLSNSGSLEEIKQLHLQVLRFSATRNPAVYQASILTVFALLRKVVAQFFSISGNHYGLPGYRVLWYHLR